MLFLNKLYYCVGVISDEVGLELDPKGRIEFGLAKQESGVVAGPAVPNLQEAEAGEPQL